MTTKSHLRPTYTVPSSVVLWTSTRELRKFRGCHSGDSRLRMTTTKSRLRRTFTLCFGLRLSWNFDNLSPRVDLEIFALLGDLENLYPRMNLEIFTLSRDFDNLSQRLDLEIFAGYHSRKTSTQLPALQ
ncbi:hypothetical protein V1477_000912 [Vespula maculifrons]|uniref:Uncharacterized protein n=1 Tax=Vespula maculifrons TaxID=7453 RepID=A0ABD2D1L2_VESMC